MSASKLVDFRSLRLWQQLPKCSLCFAEFSLGINGNRSRNRPLILPCYHNICENCFWISNSQKQNIQCHQCDTITEYSKYRLELNYYLNGFLYDKQKNYFLNQNTISNNENTMKNRHYECNECSSACAKHFCIQCKVPYCLSCFQQLHKYGKTFQKHNLSKLDCEDNKIKFKFNLKVNKKCSVHKQFSNNFCQTCKKAICDNCVKSTHQNHFITTVKTENQKTLQQINSLIETVKMAKETNRQAIVDSKFVEKRYDQKYNEAIESVTSYYQKLHNILQLSETKFLMSVKQNILGSVGKIKQTQKILENSSNHLEDLISSLQKVVSESANYPLYSVIEKTNHILETIPCQAKFENFENAPFLISEKKIVESDLEDCLNIQYAMEDNVNILTYFGDVSDKNSDNIESIEINDNSVISQKSISSLTIDNKLMKTIKNIENYETTDELYKSSIDNHKISLVNSKNLWIQNVHVSYIKDLHEFYVQSESFQSQWDEFHKLCKFEGVNSLKPDYINVNEIYLINSNNVWYRGKILKIMKNSIIYQVFFIDFGITTLIAKEFILQIPEELQNKPNEAIKCSLIGIQNNNNKNGEANMIMNDIIANNPLIKMIVLKEDDDNWIVDLITINNFPTSIIDALIFTDVVKKTNTDSNDKKLNDNLRIYNEMKKQLIPAIKKSFYKTILSKPMSNRIIPLNIKDPQEFYVTNYDFKSDLENLQDELNQIYYKNSIKIYLPRKNMPCAVCIKGKWCRGRILEVESKLKCKVWLVDYGISEIISFKQLRILTENFLKYNEYSIKCCLIDIEPLQSNNYSWSPEAILEFKRWMKQTSLQIIVHKTKDFCHLVTLFILKSKNDINVNALLVKYGYALSTGEESLLVTNAKTNYQNDELLKSVQNLSIQDIKPNNVNQVETMGNSHSSLLDKIHSRRKIIVTSIISPGEFYIQLEKQLVSVKKLQNEIQTTQNQKLSDNPESTVKHDWQLNENCLVQIKISNFNVKNDNLQWHRGTIVNILNENYSIYLRDNGSTMHNVKVEHISPIEPKFNRLCDTVFKCNLACVRPTGGMDSWSNSSIDQLKDFIKKFDTISATVQGEKKNDSFPVVLWGMTNEYADALGPMICKWVNINKILVNNGFAHLYEQFDKNREIFSNLDKEFEETEKRIKEFWTNFVDNIAKDVHAKEISINKSILVDIIDDSDDLENFSTWLPCKPINKSIFTAIPTYIDDNGYIYLHDAITDPLLNKIKETINEKVKNHENSCSLQNLKWYAGQPCIARYHLDKCYYRGEIIDIKPNNVIKVNFVDYGNIEDCHPNDLKKELYLKNIPIQANKYELEDIVPNTKTGQWTRDVLDFIHSNIVMKMCSIRVQNNSINDVIKKCSIRYDGKNLIETLIQENYAIKKSDVYDKLLITDTNKIFKKAISKNNTIRQFLSSTEDESLPESSDDENDILKRATKTVNDNAENRKDSDYYKKYFEEKELKSLFTSKPIDKDLSDEILLDMSCISEHRNLKMNKALLSTSHDEGIINFYPKTYDNVDNIEITDSNSILSFNPIDTSTSVSRFDGFDNFPRYELPYSVKKFYCDIIFIRDPTSFFIHPLLTESDKVVQEMNQRIQIYAETAPPLLEILPKTPCLAIYNNDNLWYRAIIKSQHLNKVNVIYVDYLNSDTIPITKIRKCPKQILRYPARLMEIQLNGLTPNRRWRSSDIIRRLSKILKDCKYYAEVKKDGKIPEIQLFESQSNKNLVLQDLINERLYIQKNEL